MRELRRERGFSQEGFADECGLHRTYMSGIERGLRNVSIENVAKIAKALRVPIGELFSWDSTPGPEQGEVGIRTKAVRPASAASASRRRRVRRTK